MSVEPWEPSEEEVERIKIECALRHFSGEVMKLISRSVISASPYPRIAELFRMYLSRDDDDSLWCDADEIESRASLAALKQEREG